MVVTLACGRGKFCRSNAHLEGLKETMRKLGQTSRTQRLVTRTLKRSFEGFAQFTKQPHSCISSPCVQHLLCASIKAPQKHGDEYSIFLKLGGNFSSLFAQHVKTPGVSRARLSTLLAQREGEEGRGVLMLLLPWL